MINLKIALSAILAFFLLQGLIFQSGFYAGFLEPSSSAGLFESILRDEQKRKPFGPDEVLIVGDSRIGEGFSPNFANKNRAPHGYYFANVAVPGTNARCWYYQLRDIDPTRKRYRAIILPVDSYEDVDRSVSPNDQISDLHYCIARFRYSDLFEFAFSFSTARMRVEALRGILFKGIIYQSDLYAFFEHWRKRLTDVATLGEHGWEWRDGYTGRPQDLIGLQVDWANKSIHFPESLPSSDRQELEQVFFSPIPNQSGAIARYHRQWFGRILDLYRNSDTRIIFLALPRGPAVPPDRENRSTSHSIRDMAQRPGVILLPEDSFAFLESGDFYFDALHLNARGRAQFSTKLGSMILQALGPSRN